MTPPVKPELDLLRRYIAYVGECEGTDFVSSCDQRSTSSVLFTDDEWRQLERLAAEQPEMATQKNQPADVVDAKVIYPSGPLAGQEGLQVLVEFMPGGGIALRHLDDAMPRVELTPAMVTALVRLLAGRSSPS